MPQKTPSKTQQLLPRVNKASPVPFNTLRRAHHYPAKYILSNNNNKNNSLPFREVVNFYLVLKLRISYTRINSVVLHTPQARKSRRKKKKHPKKVNQVACNSQTLLSRIAPPYTERVINQSMHAATNIKTKKTKLGGAISFELLSLHNAAKISDICVLPGSLSLSRPQPPPPVPAL